MGVIAAGEPAPDFTLRDQDGEEISLSDFRGRRVLLVFYPFDFSSVCTDQLSTYHQARDRFEAQGVEVVGISVDHIHAHRAFRKQLGIDTTLLADFEPKGEVSRAYGSYFEPAGMSNRTLVLVDAEGRIEWSHEASSPGDLPGTDLIFDALAGA